MKMQRSDWLYGLASWIAGGILVLFFFLLAAIARFFGDQNGVWLSIIFNGLSAVGAVFAAVVAIWISRKSEIMTTSRENSRAILAVAIHYPRISQCIAQIKDVIDLSSIVETSRFDDKSEFHKFAIGGAEGELVKLKCLIESLESISEQDLMALTFLDGQVANRIAAGVALLKNIASRIDRQNWGEMKNSLSENTVKNAQEIFLFERVRETNAALRLFDEPLCIMKSIYSKGVSPL